MKAAFEIKVTVPVEGLAHLLQAVHSSGGSLRRMIPLAPTRPARRARQVILSALQAGEEACRGDLARLLELNGHAPEGVGTVCATLRREGHVYSPRRGFWRIR